MSDEMIWNYRPSNGTEGDMMRQQLCDRCTADHAGGWHDNPDDGVDSCEIILSAIAGPHSYPNPGPPQWGHNYETGESRCTAFVGPCSCDTSGDAGAPSVTSVEVGQ